MKRWTLNILSALSLLVLVALAVLWVRSYNHSDFLWVRVSRAVPVQITDPQSLAAWEGMKAKKGYTGRYDALDAAIAFDYGQCHLFWESNRFITTKDAPVLPRVQYGSDASKLLTLPKVSNLLSSTRGNINWRRLGFGYFRWNIGFGVPITIYRISVPTWALCILTLLLPTLWFGQTWKKRHRVKDGLCPTCGYDLRASKDRCPECGTPIPVQTASEKV